MKKNQGKTQIERNNLTLVLMLLTNPIRSKNVPNSTLIPRLNNSIVELEYTDELERRIQSTYI